MRRFAELVPVALLAALVAVQAAGDGQALTFDPARLAGLGAAVVTLLLRAPFLRGHRRPPRPPRRRCARSAWPDRSAAARGSLGPAAAHRRQAG